MKSAKIAVALAALALSIFAPSLFGAPPSRPVRPAPPARPAPPRAPVGIHVITGTGTGLDRPTESARGRLGISGIAVIAPQSPADWTVSIDLAANSFEMAAPLTLPRSIKSADIAALSAIFNDRVDGSSVGASADEEFRRITITGRAARFASLASAELIGLKLIKTDGVILGQELSIGLARAGRP